MLIQEKWIYPRLHSIEKFKKDAIYRVKPSHKSFDSNISTFDWLPEKLLKEQDLKTSRKYD